MNNIKIEPLWKEALKDEFSLPYFQQLTANIKEQYLQKTVYPMPKDVFRAFNLCPFNKVKVVIIGQDPYHGQGQANGLCFAVSEGINLPPSLKNIFKEIKNDLKIEPYSSGDLSRWAKQGVLMLNAVLTVLAGQPTSHKGLGWERFTDAVIQTLNEKQENIVYMLWGKYAQEKGSQVDWTKNLVLTSAHPSPYSASGFFNNHHFSQCNDYLEKQDLTAIDWR